MNYEVYETKIICTYKINIKIGNHGNKLWGRTDGHNG